jgi:hypothetical protein
MSSSIHRSSRAASYTHARTPTPTLSTPARSPTPALTTPSAAEQLDLLLDEPLCAAPSATLSPEHAELGTLLAHDRLSAPQIQRARTLAAGLPFDQRAAVLLALQDKVIYRNQRNNEDEAETPTGGTCNVTALAMALEMTGAQNPHPDMQIEDALAQTARDNGDTDLQQSSAWMGVANDLDRTGGTVVGAPTGTRAWWEDTVRDTWLASGAGVMASIQGHLVRIQGVDQRGVVVDDPYGESRLLGGIERRWGDENATSDDGTTPGNVGEDHIWPWDQVLGFTFKYFAVFT